MRVKCIEIVNALGLAAPTSPWLTLGKDYVVLAVVAYPMGAVRVLLTHGGTDFGWWPSRAFETVSVTVPSNWTVTTGTEGRISLGPASWESDGYGEEFTNGDDDAKAIFQRELNKILEESS